MATFIKGDPAAPEPDDGTTVVYDSAKSAYVPGPTPGGGGGGGATVHGELTGRSAPDQHPIGAITGLQSELNGKAEASHTHTAAQISDATTTGRAVMQASSPTAARTAIGAGTSNLALGTGPTTAAAGNHGHDLNAVTDTASRVAMTPAERTKLSGVASGATANATDAQLRDRATHTGAQAISTVTGLQSALDGKADTGHLHDARYVRTVNGTGPDGAGNVVVAGGGGVAMPFVAPAAHIIDQTVSTDNSGAGNWSALVPGAAVSVPNAQTADTTRIAMNTISLPACTISDLSIQVTTAGAAGTVIRFGIWSTDAKGKPGTLVLDSGALDAATTGWKTVTPAAALTLPAGAYWIGVAQSDSAVRYAGWEAAFPPKFGGPDVVFTKMRTTGGVWSGSALPTTLTVGRTNVTGVAAPILYAKVTL